MGRSTLFYRVLPIALLAALILGGWPGLAHAADHHVPSASAQQQRTNPSDGLTGASEKDSDGAIDSLEDAYKAVVQIEAVGTFEDPAEGVQLNAAGSGSGFIINEAGIAVTNNHVVTGGALFRVRVDGYDEPLNARVLGVSECADLAVIDIQGDGFPYLSWYDGPIRVGLDVYAIGFPLGDPELTMTKGIVAKAKANGESFWASVDSVLQHDADILPGNSGGPLVDENGQVVGVNYRMNDARQYFAISRDEALPLIETLRGGQDVDSIGLNGEAVSNGEDLYGIWVSSVKSGSPADDVGLEAGDLILRMEGIDLASDGSMADYCDILRSHGPDDVLSIEVLRFDTEELLEGQLNGRELETSFSFSDSLGTENGAESGTAGSTTDAGSNVEAEYSEYAYITDEQGILAVEVPVEWGDVEEIAWTGSDDEEFGIQLWAAPDLDAFENDWGVPGVVLSYSANLAEEGYTPADLLDSIDYGEDCTYTGREELPDGFYTGVYDVYEECGSAGSSALLLALLPEDESYLARIEVYSANEADLAASDRILDSFLVTPPGQERETNSDEAVESVFATVDDIDTSDLLYTYMLVEDPAVSVLMPDEWDDAVSDDWIVDDEAIGLLFNASPDLDGFNSGWETPGLSFYSAQVGDDPLRPVEALESNDFSDSCTYSDRVQHRHTIYGITYSGAYDIWVDCDGGDNAFVVLAALSEPADHLVLLYFLATDDADVEAFDVVSSSFYVETEATADLIAASQEASLNSASGLTEDDFMELTDDEEAVTLMVPVAWSDTLSEDWIVDGDVIGRNVAAAPDLDAFEASWEIPGVYVGVSQSLAQAMSTDEILEVFDFSDECGYDDRYELANDFFTGAYDIWTECGDVADQVFMVFAANPSDDDGTVMLLYINLVEDEDFDAFEAIISSVALGGEISQSSNQATLPTATVVTSALNLRAGPGTNYSRLATVKEGDELTVAGQNEDCAWLLVFTPSGQPGWVSGRAQYVSLDGDCATIEEVDAPASTSGTAGGSSASATQGCYTFRNELGAELNITFTNRDTSWNKTFKVAPNGESQQCFDPGRYTYTLDAPPPWGSTNGEVTINRGDNFVFPIYGD